MTCKYQIELIKYDGDRNEVIRDQIWQKIIAVL